MPVKRTIPYKYGIYSITFTCYNWLPLIDKVNGYDIVYNWFNYLKQQGHSFAATSPSSHAEEPGRCVFGRQKSNNFMVLGKDRHYAPKPQRPG